MKSGINWTLGTPEPKNILKKWRWRSARQCLKCAGWRELEYPKYRLTCMDCRGLGYYAEMTLRDDWK